MITQVIGDSPLVRVQWYHIGRDQHSKLTEPVSEPRSSIRLRGTTDMAVSTPLNVSERSFVDEKLALFDIDVWTPIRLAVVAVTSSLPAVSPRQ